MSEYSDLKQEVDLLRLAVLGLMNDKTKPTYTKPLIIQKVVEEKVYKTFSQQDFTGYGLDTLKASLEILSAAGSLPGPLKIVQGALERAYKANLADLSQPMAVNPILSSAGLKDAQTGSKLRQLVRKMNDTGE